MTAIQKAREALEAVKQLTVGDRCPNWNTIAAVTQSRFAIADICDTALAALDAETEVKVRALGWFKPDSRNTLSRAETAFGVYRVWTHHEANGRWFWSLDGYEKRSHDVASEAEGLAAAQADYELTIRSALVPPESRS